MKASGQGGPRLKNKNINLIDRFAIARDKSFYIIEVADKVYIIGVTNHTMTLLDTFDAATFAELTEVTNEPVPWNQTPVGQYGNKLTRKLVAYIAKKTGRAQQKDSDTGGSDFAETIKAAQRAADDTHEKSESGQPDCSTSKQADDPEDN